MPFELVVEEILERVEQGVMGVVLKRMMMKIASEVAERFQIRTGHRRKLRASFYQTLTNLNVIDRATPTLVLRPLVGTWINKKLLMKQSV